MRNETEQTFLDLEEVERRLSLRKSFIYSQIRLGRFPKPVKFSRRAARWVLAEILEWERARIAEREESAAA